MTVLDNRIINALSQAGDGGPRFKLGADFKPSPYLRHVEPGTVSISASGLEIVFGLARSLTLDASHLVRLSPESSSPTHEEQQTYLALPLCCEFLIACAWRPPLW